MDDHLRGYRIAMDIDTELFVICWVMDADMYWRLSAWQPALGTIGYRKRYAAVKDVDME